MPKVVEVIESEICRGKGVYPSLARSVRQHHTLKCDLLAESDPCSYTIEQITDVFNNDPTVAVTLKGVIDQLTNKI